jgi:hypothetical protein|tara:strand:+ start:122 stop:406 length:285 start_codon:yes stop_codon:yes gene_type:complete
VDHIPVETMLKVLLEQTQFLMELHQLLVVEVVPDLMIREILQKMVSQVDLVVVAAVELDLVEQEIHLPYPVDLELPFKVLQVDPQISLVVEHLT